ncbi:MAG: DUF3108 domain-containing protein [Propionivibrio sp.]
MPYALVFALLVSLVIHLALLCGAAFDFLPPMETKDEPLPLLAELQALAKPPPRASPLPPSVKPQKAPAKIPPKPRSKPAPPPRPKPVMSVPAASSTAAPSVAAAPEPVAPVVPAGQAPVESVIPAAASRLPANGAIDYRVDRGDANFAIGVARHQWQIDGNHYRLTSMVQSTGIVWLFKDFRVEMESRGTITADGLRPDFFVLRRNDKPTREKAFFDWQRMKVRVGEKKNQENQGDQDLDAGAQDLLSFNYQLGFLPDLQGGTVLPLATGRKYAVHRIESLGDEEIETPAGRLRTLHLRAPGDNTIDLWLAYDHQLLPVKIRFVDGEGGSLVQVATHIETSPP